MFTLENITKLKGTLLALSLAILVTGCNETASKNESSVDGAVKYPIKDGKYTQYHVNTQKLDGLNIGRDATKKEIAAWNKDVMYEGTGLPEFDMHEGEVVLAYGQNEPIVLSGFSGFGFSSAGFNLWFFKLSRLPPASFG